MPTRRGAVRSSAPSAGDADPGLDQPARGSTQINWLLAGSGGFGRDPAWGSGCRPARVVTFRSPVLRDWSNVGNLGSVQDGFGVGRAVAGDPLGFRRGAGPAGFVPGLNLIHI